MTPGGSRQSSPQPAPAAAIRIPNPTDPDIVEAARRKRLEEFANRQGRDSTRVAGGSGGSYSRTTLG